MLGPRLTREGTRPHENLFATNDTNSTKSFCHELDEFYEIFCISIRPIRAIRGFPFGFVHFLNCNATQDALVKSMFGKLSRLWGSPQQ
mgnify:CR=1 FL=1